VITLLVDATELEGGSLVVEGARYRHLVQARRAQRRETIRVTDGNGRARWARLEGVDRRRATLRLGDAAPANEPSRRVGLFVGAPRAGRAAWLVEKAVEIGVSEIVFARTARSPRRYGSATRERLRRVAAAAVEQSHRACLPAVDGTVDWPQMLSRAAAYPEAVLLDVGGAVAEPLVKADVAVFIGPEGGWSDAERATLRERGARLWSWGRRPLRVETAAVAAASLMLLAPRRNSAG
jgi:16S rRNA (uracil1498-N3)-methyltransferase